MENTACTTDEVVGTLAAAPAHLTELAESLSPTQLLLPPAPSEWSARDVLAHLRSCSDMWGASIARILREDHPTIKAVNPTTWIKQTNYCELEFHPSLEAFTAQRADLVALLKPLLPEAWSRTALVTGAGTPRERSLFSYAQRLANHERPHLKQIGRIVAALRG